MFEGRRLTPMIDVLTTEQRHHCMARIKGKDTKPELYIRSMVHRMGYRFRLHRKDLPGKPDIVLGGLKKVIFVHGCFWHNHACRHCRVKPQTNPHFWQTKRQSNADRDRRNVRALRKAGWQVLVVWECWIKDPLNLERRIGQFLTKSQFR